MGSGRDRRKKRKRALLRATLERLEERLQLKALELERTDEALAEAWAREAKWRGDPRPWWARATEIEGGCPL